MLLQGLKDVLVYQDRLYVLVLLGLLEHRDDDLAVLGDDVLGEDVALGLGDGYLLCYVADGHLHYLPGGLKPHETQETGEVELPLTEDEVYPLLALYPQLHPRATVGYEEGLEDLV